MDTWVLILLRIVHIVAGVAWVGFAFMFAGFIAPLARSRGPLDGSRFLNTLLDHRWFSTYISSAEGLAVITGGVLYWRLSGGFDGGWMMSPPGLAFGVSGLAGLVALIVSIGISRTLSSLYSLGEEYVNESDEDPSRIGRFHQLHRTLARYNRLYVLLLAAAVVGMATARYL